MKSLKIVRIDYTSAAEHQCGQDLMRIEGKARGAKRVLCSFGGRRFEVYEIVDGIETFKRYISADETARLKARAEEMGRAAFLTDRYTWRGHGSYRVDAA